MTSNFSSRSALKLFANRSVTRALEAQQVYRDWRYRPTIEHLYRFIQEDGLDVEEIQVQTLERQRRTFVLVLAAALFVLCVPVSGDLKPLLSSARWVVAPLARIWIVKAPMKS